MLTFQDIILSLQAFWAQNGCAIIQPYDMEVGAGTFHPATVLRCIDDKPWKVAYVQPSRRPTDSRFGEHPNRMGHYYQFQVILKPFPQNIQLLYLKSLQALGIDLRHDDIRFVEDDWESPTVGAKGLGWEVWFNGMEVSQFTYMQQIGGIECGVIAGEITYGLERIAMYIQNVQDYKELRWSADQTYADIDLEYERQMSHYSLHHANIESLKQHFTDAQADCQQLIQEGLPVPAYDFCIKASHIFNLLNARKVLSVTQRTHYIARVRNMAKMCCQLWKEQNA